MNNKTKKILAKSLYIVNKQAKVYRDEGREKEKKMMYHLKDLFFIKMRQEEGLAPVGYHIFPYFDYYYGSRVEKRYLYYEFGGFEFHLPAYSGQCENLECLGEIEGEISSGREDVGITAEEAIKNLEDFLGK